MFHLLALSSHPSRSWFFSRLAPRLLLFSTSRLHKGAGARSHALRPLVPHADEVDSKENEGATTSRDLCKKSRNELKREARRAVLWGVDLATFSSTQIKRIVRAASLEDEVFDAIMLVKRLDPDVREGRRRQFNYIGRLLRKAQPELIDDLIRACKDGDTARLQALSGHEKWCMDDSEDCEQDIESEEEEGEIYLEVADKWFDGLVQKDPSTTSEVYSVHTVDFDRQELRRLVRRVLSVREGRHAKQNELNGDSLLNSEKQLLRFLRSLAKKSLAESV
ncbi:hypothetical protein HPP92_004629 [Vanilla planifolia]|uniref:Uncharacterized protein n=1 Tax=Vanilla planifolia TaxID=51239 RepID=A0A835RSJ9_VANPL|nr:hypothetical protein HPP92_004629 [Vanilla planifolia]